MTQTPVNDQFPAKRVIVAHPGLQHSYETALAMQEYGMLNSYITGIYYDPRGSLGRAVKLLPGKFGRGLDRQLLSRNHRDLDASLIRTVPAPELLYLAACRFGPFRRHTLQIIYRRNQWFGRKLGRVILRERPDAVICYDTAALGAFKAAKSVGTCCILDQSIADVRTGLRILRDEAASASDFAEGVKLERKDRFSEYRQLEPALADHIFAPSQFVKQSLIENGIEPSKITVVPFGVDVDSFRPVPSEDRGRFHLLFVGGLGQRKGVKYLLEAVKQLDNRNIELTLVGWQLVDDSALTPYRKYFNFVRNVPYQEVHSYYQQADAFVFPSLFEGSARVTYEALASGLPVITTPNAGSVVRDGIEGYIVPIRDVEALKERIVALYENPELREEMSRRARLRAEQFRWAAYRRRVAAAVAHAMGVTIPQISDGGAADPDHRAVVRH